MALTVAACATQPAVKSSAPTRTTKCWAGQLTRIDKSGYDIASVPMLLRVERDPARQRMVRELALGEPATTTRDVLHVATDGTLSFLESDLDLRDYRADGDTAGEPWGDAVNLELVVPGQSVRSREWAADGLLYGHYRYRDADGSYNDERFHALSPLPTAACNDWMEAARAGGASPAPTPPAAAEHASPAQTTLTYAWPANLDATARLQLRRSGTAGAAANNIDATYQLRTTPTSRGMQVLVRSRELLAMPSHTLDDKDRWERATVLASLFPSVMIDDAGAVSELAEGGDYLHIVRAAFLERWGGGQDTEDEDVLAYVDQNLSAQLAIASAQRYWNPLVAFWAGATLTAGAVERVALTRAVFVPGALKPVVVQVPTEFTFEGWVRCNDRDPEARCVRLVSTFSVGEWDIRNELADAGPDGKPIRVMRHRDDTTTVLITDPKTLLPYHYYELREIDSLMGDATKMVEIQRREEIDLTFQFAVPRSFEQP